MKKYIELSITGKQSDLDSYLQYLQTFSSDAFSFSESRNSGIDPFGFFIEFKAKRAADYRSRVILFFGEGSIQVCNIIPRTVSFLELEQYNSVLKDFYKDVILSSDTSSLKIKMTKEDNEMKDLISAPAYLALVRWEGNCNKSSPTSHPNDRERWLDFICELYINKDYLSLSDFRNWLIEDKGWYFDVEDDESIFTNLELDIEFGLDIIEHYAKKTGNR